MQRYAEESGYQGWKNYETWSVALVMSNDRGEYEYWNDTADEIRQDVEDNGPSSEHWSDEESLRFELADRMKNTYEENNPQAQAEE